VAAAKGNARAPGGEPGGLWHQPALLNLLADLLIVFAVAALAWAAVTALQRLPLFPLREVTLAGIPAKVTPAQIEHAARTAVTGNFFTVDIEAARTAFEGLPWVRRAVVQRQWPAGLMLTLEEHEVVARWRHAGREDVALVNVQGEIFDGELAADLVLPWLSGPEGSAPEMLRRLDEFAVAFRTIGRSVDILALSQRRAWRVRLDDGTLVELGRDQERHPLAERVARFVTHQEAARKAAGNFRVADMRYPGGFVIGGLAPADARAGAEGRS